MTKDEKKLAALNKLIAGGRIRYALYFSLVLLFGFSIGYATQGEFIAWFFNYAWLSFLVAFAITAWFWSWKMESAANLAFKTGQEVASPPASNGGYWIATIIVFILLIFPPIYKKDFARWALDYHQHAVTELEFSMPNGNKIKLNVPQPYIIRQHNKDLGFGFMDSELSKLTLTASLDTMQPVLMKQYGQTPVTNPNIVFITMRNLGEALDKAFMQEQYDKFTKDFPESVTKREEAGITITTAKIYDPKSAKTGMIELGMASSEEENVFLLCDKRCVF